MAACHPSARALPYKDEPPQSAPAHGDGLRTGPAAMRWCINSSLWTMLFMWPAMSRSVSPPASKRRIQGVLQHYLRNHGRLVRAPTASTRKTSSLEPSEHLSQRCRRAPFSRRPRLPRKRRASTGRSWRFRRWAVAKASGQLGRDPARAGARKPVKAKHRRLSTDL